MARNWRDVRADAVARGLIDEDAAALALALAREANDDGARHTLADVAAELGIDLD